MAQVCTTEPYKKYKKYKKYNKYKKYKKYKKYNKYKKYKKYLKKKVFFSKTNFFYKLLKKYYKSLLKSGLGLRMTSKTLFLSNDDGRLDCYVACCNN